MISRFTVLLECGCVVFPAGLSDLDLNIAMSFRGHMHAGTGRCLLHGSQPVESAILNGSGCVVVARRSAA